MNMHKMDRASAFSQRPSTLSFGFQTQNSGGGGPLAPRNGMFTPLTPQSVEMMTPVTPGGSKRKSSFSSTVELEYRSASKMFYVDQCASGTVLENGYFKDESVTQQDGWWSNNAENGVEMDTEMTCQDYPMTPGTPIGPGGMKFPKFGKRRNTPGNTPLTPNESSKSFTFGNVCWINKKDEDEWNDAIILPPISQNPSHQQQSAFANDDDWDDTPPIPKYNTWSCQPSQTGFVDVDNWD